jgi:hypothetical protein
MVPVPALLPGTGAPPSPDEERRPHDAAPNGAMSTIATSTDAVRSETHRWPHIDSGIDNLLPEQT